MRKELSWTTSPEVKLVAHSIVLFFGEFFVTANSVNLLGKIDYLLSVVDLCRHHRAVEQYPPDHVAVLVGFHNTDAFFCPGML